MSKTILLTGASGVIGRAVAERLAGDTVVGLVNSDTSPIPGTSEVLRSDLSAPKLGLSDADWERLAAEVDVVIHSAALTEWGQPVERYQAINIDGTARVIDFARAAGAPIHYVGTCFVRAIERGLVDELGEQNVVKPYIASKLEAERLLRESGVPHNVFRPTNLVGDSRTGASSRPQIVQAMSDWVCRGKAPYFPAHPGNLVDIVSLDVMADSLVAVLRAEEYGRLFWITSGDASMTPEEALDIALDHARARGRDFPRAPIIDPREPLPIPLDEVRAMSRAFLKVLIDVSEVTFASGGILPSSLDELQTRFGVGAVSDREAYRRSLDYWANERSGGESPVVQEVA